MPSKRNAVRNNDSTVDLLRLFNMQPNHHVVTRQDLTRDYGKNSSTSSSSSSSSSTTDDATSINNYYTWNSSRTNAPIHKERAAIVSALHSTRPSSYPSLPSWPRPSKSFTRSHRVRDIVSMCQDSGSAFSSEEYHNGETSAVEPDDGWSETRPDHESLIDSSEGSAENDREPFFGLENSRCWSCSATDGSDDGQGGNSYYLNGSRLSSTKDNDDDEEEETSQETNRDQSSSSWKQRLTKLMFNIKKPKSR